MSQTKNGHSRKRDFINNSTVFVELFFWRKWNISFSKYLATIFPFGDQYGWDILLSQYKSLCKHIAILWTHWTIVKMRFSSLLFPVAIFVIISGFSPFSRSLVSAIFNNNMHLLRYIFYYFPEKAPVLPKPLHKLLT